ncbi:dual oxidase 1-like [Glandiceps talaboti]
MSTRAPDPGIEEFGAVKGIGSVEQKGFETIPYDGWYHNEANPDWGAADTTLTRGLPADYSDGVYQPAGNDRPNPRQIANAVMSGWTGHGSYLNRTALLVFFGQQIVEEILDAKRPGCPPEYFNIPIPKGDPDFDPDGKGDVYIPLLRTRHQQTSTGYSSNVPREQINEITPWIDGGLVYGISKAWTDALRTFEDGKLKSSEDGRFPALNNIGLPMANPPPPRDHYLKNAERFYMLGNPRGNENPFLLTFGVLLFRWHNVLADRFHEKHPDWDDERIFLTARKWVIATHQKIVVYDWLPAWLNDTVPEYSGYQSSVNPGITHEFQSAAMRFGHTLVPPGVYRRNAQCEFRNTSMATGSAGHHGLRTCNTYWNPQEAVEETDIDEILLGMASQIAEREDNIITEDLRGKVFGPLEFSRRDLMAINIQRGRDHGLPNYNTARIHYGLPPIADWKDVNPFLYDLDPQLFDDLSDVHEGNISKVDIWTGGLLETTPQGPGPLFNAILKNQFLKIRDGDRFWFENDRNRLFTEDERNEIWNISLYDIILNVTNIGPDDMQKDVFHWYSGDPCPQPKQLNQTDMEPCTDLGTFDYFDGSESWFIMSYTAIGAYLIGLVIIVFFWFIPVMKYKKIKMMKKMKGKITPSSSPIFVSLEDVKMAKATEWRGKDSSRDVQLKFGTDNVLQVKTGRGCNIRSFNFNNIAEVTLKVSTDKGERMLILSCPKECDLILLFENINERTTFLGRLKTVLQTVGIAYQEMTQSQRYLKNNAYTHQERQKKLEKFFKVLSSKISKKDITKNFENDPKMKEVLECELTVREFAEAFSMTPEDDFVQRIFKSVDTDGNGYISFKEFFELVIVSYTGSAEDKCKMLFDLYDLDGTGKLTKEEFMKMIKNSLSLGQADITDSNLETMVNMMYKKANLADENELAFDNFLTLLGDYKDNFENVVLPLKGATCTTAAQIHLGWKERSGTSTPFRPPTSISNNTPDSDFGGIKRQTRPLTSKGRLPTKPSQPNETKGSKQWKSFLRFMENNRLQIFYLVIYVCVIAGIFLERAYYFSVEREHSGIRRIAGYGVTVTRGAASVIMFTMAALLVTMCRNINTHLRSTFLNKFIPFDSAVAFHKILAGTLVLFTLVHLIGHGFNFYHISTQPADDLTCLFRDYFHRTHELPKFQYWLFATTTGITGVLLVLIMAVIIVFAMPLARRYVYNAFWITHKLYLPMYILVILHGSGRLIIEPIFHYFLIGPAILFTLDKLVSISRKKEEVLVTKVELLPSGVVYLEWKRPIDFTYKSGQWIQLSSAALGENEYHPFTLTSAPHEDRLSVHIRALGPWTMNMEHKYNPDSVVDGQYPKLYLNGPFGEGHQDWTRHEMCVLIGAGIGVTPFASILKDVVHQSKTSSQFRCKKVYFLWVTRTQHQFEWMMDILRDVELNDDQHIVDVHIFITQFYQKFDLRTTMLYICERHFQTMANQSLFTGLRAVTHFGRPDFKSILDSMQDQDDEVDKIGVFSCGPPSLTASVQQACNNLNSQDQTLYSHYSENF